MTEEQKPSEGIIQILSDEVLTEFLLEEVGPRAAQLMLVHTDGSSPSKLNLKWADAKTYFTDFCRDGNDCDDGQFDLDCTHFMCHGLKQAGIKVNAPETTCASGVCIRVAELAAAFKNSVAKYSNVKKLDNPANTREGDFCFIVSFFGLSKDHVMALAAPATSSNTRVYGHTNNRCGEDVDLSGKTVLFYRIE